MCHKTNFPHHVSDCPCQIKTGDILRPHTRAINLYCNACKIDNKIIVEFGFYIHLEKGAYCDLMQERPGRSDLPVKEIVCMKCGCMGSLDFKD